MNKREPFSPIKTIQNQLESNRYISDPELAGMIYLSYHLNKPIFLEGGARGRQNGGCHCPFTDSRNAADQAAVLRRTGCEYCTVRMELSQAIAAHQNGRTKQQDTG